MDSTIYIHVSILSQTPFPSSLPCNIEQNSLCYTVGPCWLFILNIAACTLQIPNSLTILSSCSWEISSLGPDFPMYKMQGWMGWLRSLQALPYLILSYIPKISLSHAGACICAQLRPTLCDPTDCSPPGCSVYGISQTRILEGVAVSFSRGSSQPRDQTCISCTGRRILYCQATLLLTLKSDQCSLHVLEIHRLK